MSITKKERKVLESILFQIQMAEKYLMQPQIAVCRRKAMATTTLDYVNPAGQAVTELEKEYGSDLVHLMSARSKLKQFLNPEPVEAA
jgi:hypothetical protein